MSYRSLILIVVMALSVPALAQQPPYFVTYNHEMEEVGSLELSSVSVLGAPRNGNHFGASQAELEYGATGWWSTAFYLDGQATSKESAVFTGYRWENRFRVLRREHWINPVVYVEFARVNGANKSLREIVGHDGEEDQSAPNHVTRAQVEKEVELKLILSSHLKGWNISENFISEKPLRHDPWEFGYAVGVSRPLAFVPSGKNCGFCKENLQVGAEFYGGLGDSKDLSTRDTSHYAAPVLAWKIGENASLRVSPSFGLNDYSHRFLMRMSFTYEIEHFGPKLARLLRAK